MKFTKKAAACFAATAMMSGVAIAADYPSKPVKIMVGFSAGGGTDTTARGFASYIHEAPSMNGLPAYIVNLPGASGQKAAKMVLGEDTDGHTLYMINIGTFIAGELAKGAQASIIVTADMETSYFCAFHPVMKAQLSISKTATR